MAGAKEIRSKIASVQNTQKITKAMEMVAASKMRKSQERMAASRPYADTMRKVIGHLANGNLNISTLTSKNATLSAWATGGVDRPWSVRRLEH